MTIDLDRDDPIHGTPNVLGSHYERVITDAGCQTVLVVETDLELGPRQGTQGSFDIEKLTDACKERLGDAGIKVHEVRVVRRSPNP